MPPPILAGSGCHRYVEADAKAKTPAKVRMNIREDVSNSDDWAIAKFGVGQPVLRTEDPTLVQGKGHYTDDIALPGQVYAAMVRSPYAHGMLNGIDTAEAAAMPGVLGVYTAKDLAAYGTFKCIVPFKNRDGTEMKKPQRFALAEGKVRFAGDPVAFVVAETAIQARDAAEAVVLDIESLPAVTLASEAAKPGAPQLYDEAPDNVALDYHYGDAEKVAAAFAQAAHVTTLSLRNTRLVVAAMEPRAAVAEYDPKAEHFTLHAQSQGVFGMKGQIVDILGVKPDQVRMLTGNVGGSFGMKGQAYSEYICILHAARLLGRPVKWTDDRSGAFVSDSHGRDHEITAELALDKDGHFLAVRLTGYANMGAFLAMVAPLPGTLNAVKNTPSVYRTPLLEVATKCVFTNTTQVSAYRGAGRPEGNYYMERLIDAAAVEMGIDRLELRRRNHIAPSQIPYAASSGMNYDSGDFTRLVRRGARRRRPHGLCCAQARERSARQAARTRHRLVPRSHRASRQGNGRHPLRRQRRRHHHHRHARLRPGSCGALCAGAVARARHSVRTHPAGPGRQRSTDRRRRHRRLALDHRERRGHSRSVRQGDRERQGHRLACAGSGGRRYRIQRTDVS